MYFKEFFLQFKPAKYLGRTQKPKIKGSSVTQYQPAKIPYYILIP